MIAQALSTFAQALLDCSTGTVIEVGGGFGIKRL